MNNLNIYVPNIYNEIKEMDAVIATENIEFQNLQNEIDTVRNNQYVLTANEIGIVMFETMLGIKANPLTETLEFRRQRIINRLSMSVPFTYRFLEQKLNETVGKDKWLMSLDYNTYTLTIESSAENQQWFEEIAITMNIIKPANILFINKPLIKETLNVNETVTGNKGIYNYKLGTTWNLGQKPFRTLEDIGVVKMAGISSVNNNLLNDIATFTASDIDNVIINNSYVVNTFSLKESLENNAILEYTVDKIQSGIEIITNIKLRKSTNEVLTDASVYIPLIDSVVLKHTINVKEGV